MNQYMYIYNYADNEKELCEMEFKQIFHEPMTSKYYLTSHYFPYQRSVYIRGCLNIMYRDQDFTSIIQHIEQDHLVFYDFKVIYIKNDMTHVHYQESIQKCKEVALPIAGSVNMHHPQVIIGITKIKDYWYVGLYESDMIWNQREDKPWTYSHSLNIRDARTCVNIALGNQLNQTLVDPCCGIGTVVLEALSMGVRVKGYDINRYVAYQARQNLEYFHYDPLIIERKDIHELYDTFDVMIMDIPYGVYSPFSYEQQLSLLQEAYRISKRLVLISHQQMHHELVNIGYHVIDGCSITKGTFTRYITLCEG